MALKTSFKSKLILSYLLIILISFAFLAFFLDKNLEDNSLRNIENSLINQAYLVESRIASENLKKSDTARLDPLITSLSRRIGCRITVIDSNGKVLADSEKPEQEIPKMENHLHRPEVQKALKGDTGIDTRYSSTLRIEMLYVALPLMGNGGITGILRLALPLASVKETLGEIRKTIVIGLAFALAVAFVLGSVMAGKTIRPINRMTQVSRRFSEGDFSRRIIRTSGDEIGELADTLNKMAEDIENKIGEIRTQNQKLAAIFNSMIEGVIVVDKDARIISINPTIEKIFGILKKDAPGKVFLEAIRNNDISDIIRTVLGKGEAASRELALVYPVQRIFEVNVAPIFDDRGVAGCLVVIHDITEIRRLEKVRSDFVANVSHELKTPLTSIKGFIETLLEGALSDKENAQDFLKIIHEHAERLNNLVNDLLSLSHLESREITLSKEAVNLKQQAEEVISGFKSQLKKRAITVKDELPEGLSIRADKNRIEQVLTNLVDNAIKFNKEKGSVRIYSQEIDGRIKITVEDTGIGIPEKD
ncbi:MAG: histidine kinase dimerization/phospho-acceptor domain-containing protein, partial [Candidatus Omnitrophica bacterium]|nr:histidine kinase dimerization/phospho-acceptor domain-containing protein [Candidatus Omnitrophota bacterium]